VTEQTSSLELLKSLYGKPMLGTEELAKVFHYKNATAVARAVSAGTFPVPTMKIGKARVADIRVVAAYLDAQS